MSIIEVTDVFLRDGLQDEDVVVSTADKLAIAAELVAAGVPRLEVVSFVNPKRVPQMADAEAVVAGLPSSVRATVLALNGRGVDRAAAAGAREVQAVASASEAHSSANAGRSTADALAELSASVGRHPELAFVAGISTAFVCPFEGDIPASRLVELVGAFLDLGVTTIGLADTLGTATSDQVLASVDAVRQAHPEAQISLHLHNAKGQALETVVAAARNGITRFDGAIAGFGGCPFAPGAHGNIATEELVRTLHEHGFSTGIDEARLGEVAARARATVATATPISSAELV